MDKLTDFEPYRKLEAEVLDLRAENKRLKKALNIFLDVKCNMPSWWWEKSIYPENSDDPISLDEAFDEALNQ
jgi:hypothetical protein